MMLRSERTNRTRININADLKNLEGLMGRVKNVEIAAACKGLALQAFDFIVKETPQWSGSMAASTRIYAGRIDYSYTAITGDLVGGEKLSAAEHAKFGGKTDIQGKSMVSEWKRTTKINGSDAPVFGVGKKGDSDAIQKAYAENMGNLNHYSDISKPIFITNNVKHSTTDSSYAKFVEINRNSSGSSFLRSVNLPSGMYAEAAVRFGNMGQLSEHQFRSLTARAREGI